MQSEGYFGTHRQTLRGAAVNEELRRIAAIESKGKDKSGKYRLGATIVSKLGLFLMMSALLKECFAGNGSVPLGKSEQALSFCMMIPSYFYCDATANRGLDQEWCTHAKAAAR